MRSPTTISLNSLISTFTFLLSNFLHYDNSMVANALSIDNGISGNPEIDCGPQGITVNFNTKNPFEGHIFVKGHFKDDKCRRLGESQRTTGITIPFTDCGAIRTRSLSPRGVYVTTTVVINFHEDFITMIDGAFLVQCFYMEADKTVSSNIEVSMLTTVFQERQVPMPSCAYTIHDGGPDGDALEYVIVGQRVYHKWSCTTETPNTFCIMVHSCYVDDGDSDRVELVDPSGCIMDKVLISTLDYETDLMAGGYSMVFKYADRPTLFFQCQISLSIKEPNGPCPKPQCNPSARALRLHKRSSDLRKKSDRVPAGLYLPNVSDNKTMEYESSDAVGNGKGEDRERSINHDSDISEEVSEHPLRIGTVDVASQYVSLEPSVDRKLVDKLNSRNFETDAGNICVSPAILVAIGLISVATTVFFVCSFMCFRRARNQLHQLQ